MESLLDTCLDVYNAHECIQWVSTSWLLGNEIQKTEVALVKNEVIWVEIDLQGNENKGAVAEIQLTETEVQP